MVTSADPADIVSVRRSTVPDPALPRMLTRTRWWGFWLYAIVSIVHVGAIALDLEPIVYPTKLVLMPALILAVMWALSGSRWPTASSLLLAALAFSWLGDGAGFFFPLFDDTLPMMLLCFGIAHLLYMWLFLRHIRARRVPRWALVYAVWWIAMVAILWPHLGWLQIPVALYGLVLGGTAALSTRGGTITAIGGAFFLASDTILALRLFLPGGLPEVLAGPWVMVTYTIGQGILAYGIVRHLRRA